MSKVAVTEKEAKIAEADRLNAEAHACMQSDVKNAFDLATRAGEISREAIYPKGYAESLRTLGQCYERFSDYSNALEKSLEAIEIFKTLGDKKGESDCLNTLGGVYNYLGDHKSRLKCNLRTLELREEAGDKNGVIGSLNNLGDTYMKLGEFEKALETFHHCLRLENVSDRNRAILLHNIGETYFTMNDFEKAEPALREGLEWSSKSGYKSIFCVGNILLSEILIRSGRHNETIPHLEAAMETAEQLNSRDDIFAICKCYADVYEAAGDVKRAYQYYKRYHELKEELFNESNIQEIKNIQFRHEANNLRKQTQAERDRNTQLQKAFVQIEEQKNEIARKNLSITDSIHYAWRLQEGILPRARRVRQLLPESFILYLPKDIVSGDFYWLEQWGNKTLLAAVDCTGHGVPGAFMSIIGYTQLNRIVNELGISKPSVILGMLNKSISGLLHRTEQEDAHSSEMQVKDGMDISLVAIDKEKKIIEFAGAFNPLYRVRKQQLQIFPPDRFPIGVLQQGEQKNFTNTGIPFEEGDCFYLFSDGYADQFGGPKGKKFKYKQFQEKLTAISTLPMEEQKKVLEETFSGWKGDLEQVDDVLIIGLRV